MKKTILLAALGASLCSSTLAAEEVTTHFLEDLKTQSGVEYIRYKYNDFNKVSEIIHKDNAELRMSVKRLFTYDENGNCIEELAMQDYYMTGDPEKYVPVVKVTYDYNDKNQVSKRTLFSLDLSSGATIEQCSFIETSYLEFYYDFWGNLSQVNTLFPGGAVVQRDTYMFDTFDRITRKDSYNLFGNVDELISSLRYIYTDEYSEDSELIRIENYALDSDGVNYLKDVTDFIYDDDNLLETVEVYSGDHATIVTRDDYTYRTDFSIEDTVYPINFEDTYWVDVPEFSLFKKPVDTKESFVVNDNTYNLEYLDTYKYLYTGDAELGVEKIAVPGLVAPVMFRGIDGNKIILDGVAPSERVRLLDMEGKILFEGIYGAGINAAGLPTGAYIVMTSTSAVKFSK